MPATIQKQVLVKNIKNYFSQAKAVIFYNFHHAENEDVFRLKKELKKVNSHWKVYKNNLVKKAVPNHPLGLKQANAFIFCQEDEYKPLNILLDFNQKNSEIKKRFQGGIYYNSLVSSEVLEKWANLPSKEVSISNLCYYLTWQQRRLIDILKKIK